MNLGEGQQDAAPETLWRCLDRPYARRRPAPSAVTTVFADVPEPAPERPLRLPGGIERERSNGRDEDLEGRGKVCNGDA